MIAVGKEPDASPPGGPASGATDGKWFATTHWSLVLAAGRAADPAAQAALETLCQTYWYPLYAYIRRVGRDVEESRDLTQQFFADFLARRSVSFADPARRRFGTFLLTALKHFLANEWKRENRLKRGGGRAFLSLDAVSGEERLAAEPADAATPELLYERRWAAAVLERVLELLAASTPPPAQPRCSTRSRPASGATNPAGPWGTSPSPVLPEPNPTQAYMEVRISAAEPSAQPQPLLAILGRVTRHEPQFPGFGNQMGALATVTMGYAPAAAGAMFAMLTTTVSGNHTTVVPVAFGRVSLS